MNICVIGTGYVGLVVGTCFAETGNKVICVDVNKSKIERLQKGESVIYEPGLEHLIKRNLSEKRLEFTTDLPYGVSNSVVIFIAVGTPMDKNGSADLSYVVEAAKSIGQAMNSYKIIVNKSTVPIGTVDLVREVIAQGTTNQFDVVSNPEFLKEGMAVSDFMKPDRVIIGTDNNRVAEIMKKIYAPFVRTGNPVLVMDNKSAEMTKYASNAMLASRISFMNEIACLCERTGADVEMVRRGMSADSRIGHSFLFPGVGYGGSCFPKDVQALIRLAKEYHFTPNILRAIEHVNERQKRILAKKVARYFADFRSTWTEQVLKDRRIAVWGLAFKPQTDDMREAPSKYIIEHLLEQGASIRAYDPVAMNMAKEIFGDSIEYGAHPYDCLQGADCLLIVTEWHEFRMPDYEKMKSLMKEPIIFDGRNLYDLDTMARFGFKYFGIGRGASEREIINGEE